MKNSLYPKQSRLILGVLIFFLPILACSLTSSSSEPTAIPLNLDTATPFQSPTPDGLSSPTPIPSVAPFSSPTSAAFATARPAQAVLPPTVVNCSIRTDWPIYLVRSGDTLAGIASATGTTVQALTTANCLANPNNLTVGQSLRVPSGIGLTPVNTATPAPTLTPQPSNTPNVATLPRFNAEFNAQPIHPTNISGVSVSIQDTITLQAGVVADATVVRFYLGTSASDPAPVQIGADTTPHDGAQLSYSFNNFDLGQTLYFWAVAENQHGSARTRTLAILYEPAYPIQNE